MNTGAELSLGHFLVDAGALTLPALERARAARVSHHAAPF